jgi:DNA-binding transcriptional ArsR family regulator
MNTEYSANQGLGFDLEPVNRNVKQASSILKAMSNRHRLLVLCQLAGGEKSVGELEKITGLSQSALSQHLARLRRQNLVKTRRHAQAIFYSLDGDEAVRIIGALHDIFTEAEATSPLGTNGAGRGSAAYG